MRRPSCSGINNEFTLRHFAAAVTASRNALLDTMALATAASAVTAVVGVLAAYYVARTALVGRNALDFLANLPLAIPGTVVGLAFALAFNHWPLLLTGTALIIIVAFTVRSLPYSMRSGVVTLNQLHRSLDEASTSMGATSGQTLMRVLLPLLRPALLAGMIFTFTRSVTTLSAVIFVVSPHWSLVTPTILSQNGPGRCRRSCGAERDPGGARSGSDTRRSAAPGRRLARATGVRTHHA